MQNQLTHLMETELLAQIESCNRQEALFLEIAAQANQLVTMAQRQRSRLQDNLIRLRQAKGLYSYNAVEVRLDYLDTVHEE